MPELSYDIWLNISRYIYKDQLKELYSVNRALFEIAMDERYREVSFLCLSEKDTQRNLARLRDPQIARRVHRLYLFPALIGKPICEEIQRSTDPWPQRLRSTFNMIRGASKRSSRRLSFQSFTSGRQTLEVMQQIMGNLKNVQDYHVEFSCNDNLLAFQYALPALILGWTIFGTKLTSLTLDVPLEGLRDFIHPCLRFRQLTALTIRLSKSNPDSDCTTIIKEVLKPFINNHHASLAALVLTSINNFDFSALLLGLHHFPYLSKLTISHPFVSLQETATSGLRHILALHSGGLRELGLRFHTPPNTYAQLPSSPSWFGLPFFQITLSGLEVLDLTLRDQQDDVPWAISYLRNFRQTLRSLTLRNYTFRSQEVESLVVEFEEGYLEMLDIAIDVLYPRLMDRLAETLVGLEDLRLQFGGFDLDKPTKNHGQQGHNATTNSKTFCLEMAQRNYRKWNLRSLTLSPTTEMCGRQEMECIWAAADAIPSLKWLNGKDVALARYGVQSEYEDALKTLQT